MARVGAKVLPSFCHRSEDGTSQVRLDLEDGYLEVVGAGQVVWLSELDQYGAADTVIRDASAASLGRALREVDRRGWSSGDRIYLSPQAEDDLVNTYYVETYDFWLEHDDVGVFSVAELEVNPPLDVATARQLLRSSRAGRGSCFVTQRYVRTTT